MQNSTSTNTVKISADGSSYINGGNVGIGTSNPSAKLDVAGGARFTDQNAVEINPFGSSAGNTGELRFEELAANGTHYVGFKAPDALAGNVIWSLPSVVGNNGQVLSSDGNGGLSWINMSSGATVTSVAGRTGAVTLSSSDISGLGALATSGAVSGGSLGTITDNTITNADISSSAAIATSKLSGAVTSISGNGLGSLATASAVSGGAGGTINDGTITNDDISASASILDTKLATIATAGKVSGAAITSGTIGGTTAINTSGNLFTSGNIGISTTTPAEKLHIVGNIRMDYSGYRNSYLENFFGSTRLLNNAYSRNIGGSGVVNDAASTPNSYIELSSGEVILATGTGGASGVLSPASPRLTVKSSGSVGIGTTTPSYTLHVVGSAGLSSGTAWTAASDIRLKDIDGDYEYGLDEIKRLHTVRFHYKKDNPLQLPSDHAMTGFIAQEVQEVIPDAVKRSTNGYLELNVDPIHWATVNAVKELADENAQLKQRVDKAEERADKAEERADRAEAETAEIKRAICAKLPDLSFCGP